MTTRLNELVDNGLVRRERYSDRPPRDRYVLTRPGRELVPILCALTAWGDRWQTPPGGPPVRFRHDGHPGTPTVSCSTCGEALTAENIDVRPGPGGRAAPGTRLVGDRILPRR